MLRRFVVLMSLVALLLVAVDNVSAQRQSRTKLVISEVLKSLKPGQWVKLEGTVRPDQTVLCTELKILTGDFLNDDWKLGGIVRAVDKKTKQLMVLNLSAMTDDQTVFDKAGDHRSFEDVKVGMLIELEGTYRKDGTFWVKEVEDESAKLLEKPQMKGEFEVRGKIGMVDTNRRTLRIVGVTFQLMDKTQVKSAIK